MLTNKFKPFVLFACVLILSIFLSIVLTWPFATKLSTYYTDSGDYPLNVSILWYNWHSVINGKIANQKEYYQGYQAYPQPYSLTFGNNTFAPSLIFGPIYSATHSLPLSANLFSLLTFILTFIASFYAINYFLKNSLASIIGATIFTFNPLIMARFPEHLDLMNRYFLPPLFLFLWRFFKKPNFKDSLLSGLFLTLNALSVSYYFFFSTVIILILVIFYLVGSLLKKDYQYLINIGRYGLVSLLFIPLILYFYTPYLEFSAKEKVERPISASNYFSARGIDLISASPDSLIYSGFVHSLDSDRHPKDTTSGIFNYQEHSLGLNLVPTFLFFAGIYLIFKGKRKTSQDPEISGSIKFYSIILISSFLLMLGPYFVGWNADNGSIRMPFYLFYQLLPFLKGIRVPSRFEFIFYLPFSLFSAWAVKRLMGKKIVIFIILIGLITLENYTVKDFSAQSNILGELRASTTDLSFLKGARTVHLPVRPPDNGEESSYLTWVTQTGEDTMNINAGYLPPDQTEFLMGLKDSDPNSLRKLAALKIDYLIVHKNGSFSIQNLRNLKLDPQICDFDKDVGKDLRMVTTPDTFSSFYVLTIKPKEGCVIPNLEDQRYQTLSLSVNGQNTIVHLRLPIILEGGKQVILNELDGSLTIEKNSPLN